MLKIRFGSGEIYVDDVECAELYDNILAVI
jgi:hypothetical protein